MPMQRSLADWLSFLEAQHSTEIDLGLERIAQVAGRLFFTTPAPTVISVAGTNGKGSCVAVLEHLLLDAGYSVGCYTSPHFTRYNERIHLNGQEASDELICRAFEQIEQARGEITLTYFEYSTLAAMLIMAEAGVDVAVLEVGLGGRLDAVNLVDADIAIVTSIALDHQDWLGNDLNVIAGEKAGIARSGKPLIHGDSDPLPGIVETVKAIGAELFCAGRDFCFQLPELNLPLPSVYCALQAVAMLDKSYIDDLDFSTLDNIQLTGRFQQLQYNGVNIILDVAHNPAAAENLASRLRHLPTESLRAVVGVMADKDIDGVVVPLKALVDYWYPVEIPEQARAADARQWQRILYNTPVFESVENGFEQALAESQFGDTVLVFGSFFTVAPVLQWLTDKGVIE